MKFVEFIKIENIDLNLKGKTKETVIKNLISMLNKSGDILDSDLIFKAVMKRENIASTAFADGIALPHPHEEIPNAVSHLSIAIGRSKTGVDFDSFNGKPTYLFFMLCATNIKEHLNTLAHLSRLFHNAELRDALINAPSPQSILDIIEMEDN